MSDADRARDADRALVKNAADPQQVRRGARTAASREKRFRAQLRTVLATPDGRAVCWDLLTRAGIFRSIWSPNALIHYNAGRQDFGHELMALILAADPVEYQRMETEARARERRDADDTDAAHTPPADRGDTE